MNTKKLCIIERVFIILVILSSGTLVGADYPILYLLVATWLVLYLYKEIDVSSNLTLSFIVILLLWICQLLFFDDPSNLILLIKNYMLLFCCVSYFSSNTLKQHARINYFVKVLFAFSILSLVLYLLLLAGINLPTIRSQVYGTKTILYLDSYTESTLYGILGYRNGGLYWEPGMFQVYLNFLLLYYLYNDMLKKSSKMVIITILLFLIVSTGSITGYAIAVIVVLVYCLRNRSITTRIVMTLVATIIIFIVYPILEKMIYTKITIGKSYDYRMADLIEGLRIFLQRPILGRGVINNAYKVNTGGLFSDIRGSSNGISNILMNHGIIGAGIYCYYTCKAAKYLRKEYGISTICFLLYYSINLMSEPFHSHPFFYMIIGIGIGAVYTSKKHIKLDKGELL